MSTAQINTDMLRWARERSGIPMSVFAQKCGVSEDRLIEWENNARKMTFNQAQGYANKANVPFGYLFLPTPPIDELPIPDLRTVAGQEPARPSAELLDLIKLMVQRKDWYKEYLKHQLAKPNPNVGRFSIQDGTEAIVQDMRKVLNVAAHPKRGTWEDYYRDLVDRIESAGVLVMRQGYLGHHTRPLRVDEFRGFAITDEYAPVIFVNHADALGARLFTLIHELCHIWIGQSGISDSSTNTNRKEEVLCNAVAAEFLVPKKEFLEKWNPNHERWEYNLPELEALFHVSTWTLARRALTLNLISLDSYQSYIADQQAPYKKRASSGSPTYYRMKKSQISNTFSRAVVTEALNGQVLLREASQLLGGIKPNKILAFAKELGV